MLRDLLLGKELLHQLIFLLLPKPAIYTNLCFEIKARSSPVTKNLSSTFWRPLLMSLFAISFPNQYMNSACNVLMNQMEQTVIQCQHYYTKHSILEAEANGIFLPF